MMFSSGSTLIHFFKNATGVYQVSSTCQKNSWSATQTQTVGGGDSVQWWDDWTDEKNNDLVSNKITCPADMVAPVTSPSVASGTYTTAQTINLSCSDALTGCNKTYYSIDGSQPTIEGKTVTLSNFQNYTLKYYSVDWAGNAESVQTANYTINLGGCQTADAGDPNNVLLSNGCVLTHKLNDNTNPDVPTEFDLWTSRYTCTNGSWVSANDPMIYDSGWIFTMNKWSDNCGNSSFYIDASGHGWCGSANGGSGYLDASSPNLCDAGSVSNFLPNAGGSETYAWQCVGGSGTVSCAASW
jgi:hypothetical protein